jgi:hypothetical protein
MDIHDFSALLARRIAEATPNSGLSKEADFERRHVVEPAWELSRQHPEVRVFTHPEKRKTKCKPTCPAGAPDFLLRVEGRDP